LLAACQPAATAERKVAINTDPARLRDELVRADYTADVGQWTSLDPAAAADGLEPAAAVKLASLKDGSFRKFSKPSLSSREARLLGVTVLPTGYAFTSLDTYQQVAGYFLRHRTVPPNAAACLDFLEDPARAQHFAGLSREQRMVHVAPLVDPLTGRLYGSFANPDQPFGFRFEFEPLDESGTAAAALPEPSSGEDCHCPGSSGAATGRATADLSAEKHVLQTPDGPWAVHWRCTVTRFGETPGTVLERSVFVL
jgi:hypothetical protein